MCNGNKDFQNQWASIADKQTAILQGKFPDRTKFPPHIPTQLRRIITTALKLNGTDRYNTILDMINDLSKIDKGLDWRYSIVGRTYVWEHEEDDKVRKISIFPNNGHWDVKGEQISIGKVRAKNEWNSTGHANEAQAFKAVQKIITSN